VNKKILSDLPKILIYLYFFISLSGFFVLLISQNSDYRKIDVKKPTDFIAFMVGGTIARDGKIRELYNTDLQTKYMNTLLAPRQLYGLLSFRALPLTAYLYAPLAYLDPVKAFYITALINVILLFLSIWVIKKTFDINSDVFWLCTAIILEFIPFRSVVVGGQLSAFIFFILCVSIYLTKHSKYFGAGMLLGLLFLKVNLLALVPFFFITEYLRSKKSIGRLSFGFLLSSLIFVGINILIYGPDLISEYPKFLLHSETLEYGTLLIRNFNPLSIMSLLTTNRLYMFGGSAIISAIIAFFFLLLFRKTKNFDLLYASIPALGLFLNFHTMNCDLFLLTLSIFLIANYYYNRSKKPFVGIMKAFGVNLLFFASTWIAVYDKQIIGLIILLLFFYFTLRSSISSAKKIV